MSPKTTSLALIAKDILVNNKIAVIKTDTLYGIIASVNSTAAISKINKIKKRQPNKPYIVLISSYKQLVDFKISSSYKNSANAYWPGPVSIIMPINNPKYNYLASNGKIAFRLPNDPLLQKFLDKTCPVVAPSANPEGLTPAKNIKQAKNYFGDSIDYYIDSGECLNTTPSKLIDITSGKNLR